MCSCPCLNARSAFQWLYGMHVDHRTLEQLVQPKVKHMLVAAVQSDDIWTSPEPNRTRHDAVCLLQPLESISMAEDRKQGPSASNSPNQSPQHSSASPGFDLMQDPGQLDAASLPDYVAQLQLRYQQHLAAAMASMASPTQPAQPPPQKPLASLPYTIPDFKQPQLEERSSYSGSFGTPSSHQQWLENLVSRSLGQSLDRSEFSPQTLGLHGYSSDPSMISTRGPSAVNNSSGSEYSADNLTMLAQQSVANAAADRLNSQVSLSEFNSAMSNAYGGMRTHRFCVTSCLLTLLHSMYSNVASSSK